MIEEILCTLQGYIHELEENRKSITNIVHSDSSNIESKILLLKQAFSDATQIESKVKGVSSMSNLVAKNVSCEEQEEEEVKLLKDRLYETVVEINKSIDSEIKNLKSLDDIISNLKTEMNEVKEYINEKHLYFTKQSPVSEEDDDEDNVELEQITVICSEIESWSLTVGSLKSQVTTLKAKPCKFEHANLEHDALKIEKDHEKLLSEAKLFLKTKTEYYDRLKKIDDLCELCNIWLETKSKETLNLIQYHSLKSNGMTTQIAQLQRIFNDIKEYEDDTILKAKELTKLGSYEIESEDLDDLKESLVNLKEIVLKNIRSLNDVFEDRTRFEKSLERCVDWIKNAESIVFSDIPETGHIETLNQHLERYSELIREKEDIHESLVSLSERSEKILATLNSSDQITLKSNLDFHMNQVEQLSIRCEKKIHDLSLKIDTIKSSSEKSTVYESSLKAIKERLKDLRQPIDIAQGGIENRLEMYEKLSEDLVTIKNESLEKQGLDANQRYSSKQDDVISLVDEQIIQTKELINTHEQYKSAIIMITNEISNISAELDSIKNASNAMDDLDEDFIQELRIRLKSLHLRVQECESQLCLAMDKGDQLAIRFSPQDQNEMSSLLGSLKTRLHLLKQQISDTETIICEEDPLEKSLTLEKLVTELLQLENETKTKPIMGLSAEHVDKELEKHVKHESNVKMKIDELSGLVASLKEKEVRKSEQANIKLSESMMAVLPRELLSKRKFFEDQKNARIEFINCFQRLSDNIEAAKIKSSNANEEGTIDYLNLEDDLVEHQNYFQKIPTDSTIPHKLDEAISKICQFTSKDEASELNEKRHAIDNSITEISQLAQVKENTLKDHLQKWKRASNLGPELEQILSRIRNTSINSINIHGLRRNIDDCMDNIKLLDDNTQKFETFCSIVEDIQEFADPNSAKRVSIEHQPIINNINNVRQQNEETLEIMNTLFKDWRELEPRIKELHSKCSQLEQEMGSLKTEQLQKNMKVAALQQKTKVSS